MKDAIYYETLQAYNEKIQQRKQHHQQQLAELYQSHPQLEKISDGLGRLGLQLAMASVASDDPKKLEAFRQEMETLRQDRSDLLASMGYEESVLEYQPHCPICQDEGVVDGKSCVCFQKVLIEKFYDQSNLKNILNRENFDTFRLDYYSREKGPYPNSPREQMERILLSSVQYAANFNNETKNLYFYGDPGLGKTFLSHCIAKELLDAGKLVIYQTASDLLDIIRKSKFQQNDDRLAQQPFQFLYQCDLLIIDDLGTETLTEFANNELFNLINRRLKEQKKMIISTNLPLNKLEGRYSARLASRIIGNFQFYEFFGEDIRMKKADIL
ncbi:ATP-binding protein [Alkalibacter rhizosphaerae]|uniref:ATP-binding protein n=1 Tax=Alkalibacter rhizosphaerae TaxID=2815577 RepID=A0A974XDI4_9FIRM|nr:ATP-binding protein [Alkalibacter rhizosphaerae]QSX07736.1 ATP-binding protein [Alkalibacter rhizosphaerae]